MNWTPEHVKTLTKLWQKGLSASHIAATMGEGISRNAVIGKIHRLRLNARRISDPSLQPLSDKEELSSKLGRIAQKFFQDGLDADLVAPDETMEEGDYSSVIALAPHSCRWPIGDVYADNFRFCGSRKQAGFSYCAVHARRAYQPARPKAQDKKLRLQRRNHKTRSSSI